MLEIIIEKDKNKTAEYYKQSGVEYNNDCEMLKAEDKGEIIGFCLFRQEKDIFYLLYVKPSDDLMLLDGLVRSMLHIASQRLIGEAYYVSQAPEEQLKKLGFIEDFKNKKLKMLPLLGNCENCKNI